MFIARELDKHVVVLAKFELWGMFGMMSLGVSFFAVSYLLWFRNHPLYSGDINCLSLRAIKGMFASFSCNE